MIQILVFLDEIHGFILIKSLALNAGILGLERDIRCAAAITLIWTDVHDFGFPISEDFMSFFTVLVTSKIAVGVFTGGALAAGGTATAAYTGTLPEPLQQSAHDIIGAPAAAHASKAEEHQPDADEHGKDANSHRKDQPSDAPEHPSATPVGPDATGPAAFGLCTAFTKGGLDSSSTAYKSLAAAAKGSADIATYCKSVEAPGKSAEHKSADHGHGAPDNAGKPGDEKDKPQTPAQADHGLSHKPSGAGKS